MFKFFKKLTCIDCGSTHVTKQSTGVIYEDGKQGKLCTFCEQKHYDEMEMI